MKSAFHHTWSISDVFFGTYSRAGVIIIKVEDRTQSWQLLVNWTEIKKKKKKSRNWIIKLPAAPFSVAITYNCIFITNAFSIGYKNSEEALSYADRIALEFEISTELVTGAGEQTWRIHDSAFNIHHSFYWPLVLNTEYDRIISAFRCLLFREIYIINSAVTLIDD